LHNDVDLLFVNRLIYGHILANLCSKSKVKMAFLINFAQFDVQNGATLGLGGAILVKNGQFLL